MSAVRTLGLGERSGEPAVEAKDVDGSFAAGEEGSRGGGIERRGYRIN